MKKILLLPFAAGLTFAACGINNKLGLTEYTLYSDKVSQKVTLAYLSDIHSQRFKDGGKNLFSVTDSANADCVLLGGDVFDKHGGDSDFDYTFDFLKKIKERYTNVFFAAGNHEYECERLYELKSRTENIGITVLGDESTVFTAFSGQKILIGGTDTLTCDNPVPVNQKKDFIKKAQETGLFSVLLRHVPMNTDGDEKIDLILSGHNHGGLWRIPKTDFGVAGGGKKFFPRFVHGEYAFGETKLIVSSGITTQTYLLPRLYNPPEVLKINILPKK